MAIHNTCRESATTTTVESSNSSRQPCSKQLAAVASELEQLRRFPAHHDGVQFPPACRSLLLSLPGNHHCADCGAPRPEWASISYGCMLCVQCCGRHRSYGVQTSRVRSVDMDTWTHSQILSMLEGGNTQLCRFFDRHRMTTMTARRYLTKAALFYRTNLHKHVEDVAKVGVYEGREATRRRALSNSRSSDNLSSMDRHNNNKHQRQQGITAN